MTKKNIWNILWPRIAVSVILLKSRSEEVIILFKPSNHSLFTLGWVGNGPQGLRNSGSSYFSYLMSNYTLCWLLSSNCSDFLAVQVSQAFFFTSGSSQRQPLCLECLSHSYLQDSFILLLKYSFCLWLLTSCLFDYPYLYSIFSVCAICSMCCICSMFSNSSISMNSFPSLFFFFFCWGLIILFNFIYNLLILSF